MKRLIIMIAFLSLTACSWDTVPPAHKGKILTPSGYKPDLLPPSKITTWFRDELVLIDTSTNTFKEPMTVLMNDRLKLNFEVRGRVRIDGSEKVLNAMFNDIIPQDNLVSLTKVYEVYGKMLVRNKAREILSKYSIDDVHKAYGEISSLIYKELQVAFEGTPLKVSDVALGALTFPKVVADAVEAQKEREVAIGKEKAQVEILLTKKRGEEQLAEANYRIRMLVAKTIKDENTMIAEGVTAEYLAYRQLEVQEAMASNGAAVFMPFQALESTGAQIRMFQANPVATK